MWKIQSHKKYQNACRIYLKKRITWEYNLIEQTLNIAELIWSITYDKEKILRVARSFKITSLTDIQRVVENDSFF